ncbi:hypothetical protein BH23GEM6_BH23GEM6_15990 [soil metagenome]
MRTDGCGTAGRCRGGPPRLQHCSADPAAKGRGCASGAGALVEVEVRDGLGLARVVRGRLVEVEAVIGVAAEGGEKIERREGKVGAAVAGGPRGVVADLADAGLAG